MPLAFLEVKKPNNDGGIQKEFDRMINKRQQNPDYRKFFNLIQFISFSNNMEYKEDDNAEDVKAGSFYTTPNGTNTSFSFFREDDEKYHISYPYKDIDIDKIKYLMKDCGYHPAETDTPEFTENLKTTTPCNRFVTSVFDKERFLYFLQYGIMFISSQIPEKHIMRYPQFFAARKIIERLDSDGKGGIIWHTQGSGKTAIAAFSNRVIRDYYVKKDISTRFFFVVDRLDLLTQASIEFTNRGLNTVNCENKTAFSKELNKPLSTNAGSKSIGEICVVNIQKFEGKMPEAKNDYNAKVQRIFFVDEAHRSYSSTGEFFKNLMTCDLDAVYIALTGTPLLSKKERSNLKFGDYIHKYFYDKSIADGYTLRIKKENIDTVAKSEIKKNLEIEDKQLEDKDVYESDVYVKALGEFIEKDFINFRLQNSDTSIGGMIVCRTNPQAKKVHQWFKDNSKLNTGLVITDTDDPKQKKINHNHQVDFRETLAPDILVVNFMLTTGYDVKRLKKMLEADLNENGENEGSLSGLVIDKEDINRKYHKYVDELEDIISTDNLERFSKQLTFYNKETLLKIRRLLNGIKECQTEFILSRAMDYAAQIDSDKNKKLLKSTQERIDFINLSQNTVDMMDVISNDEVVEILYEFIKVKIIIMDLGQMTQDNPKFQRFSKVIRNIQNEIKKNKNKDDIKVRKLAELLQKIFNDLSISDLNDLDSITDEFLEALERARNINYENERLSKVYGGNYAFVKTYQDAIEAYPADKSEIERTLVIIYEAIEDALDKENKNYKIVNVRNMSNTSLLLDKSDMADIVLKAEMADKYLLLESDILIARSGIPGAIRILEDSCENTICCGFIIRLSLETDLYRKYLVYKLKDYEDTTATSSGGTIPPAITYEWPGWI